MMVGFYLYIRNLLCFIPSKARKKQVLEVWVSCCLPLTKIFSKPTLPYRYQHGRVESRGISCSIAWVEFFVRVGIIYAQAGSFGRFWETLVLFLKSNQLTADAAFCGPLLLVHTAMGMPCPSPPVFAVPWPAKHASEGEKKKTLGGCSAEVRGKMVL